MISEDVIHDFFVPAFRIHVDVLPSRYTTYWFKATEDRRRSTSSAASTAASSTRGWSARSS